jgi:hypothetical protein
MTAILGREDFAAARRAQADAEVQAARAVRDQALAALLAARVDFAEDADQANASGPRLAGRDSDRLEAVAGRILGFVDTLEAEFDRLDVARDLAAPCGPGGRRLRRSPWDRPALALGLGETLQELLAPSAGAVLAAAIRLEACG